MLKKIRMVGTFVCACSLSIAADTGASETSDQPVSSVLKSVDTSPSTSTPIINSPANTATNGDSSDGSIRVAARPKLLDLSFGKKKEPKEISIPEPDLSFEKDVDEDAKVEAKKIESAVDRRMQSLERSIKREEQRLESRLEDLGKRREKALEKGDVDQLDRIQESEKQAVVDYERRIERLLSAIAKSQPTPLQRSIGNRASSSTVGSSPRPTQSLGASSNFRGSNKAKPQPARVSPLTRQPSPLNPPIGRRGAPSWNQSSPSTPKAKSNAAAGAPSTASPKPNSTPPKRRFKLWPFR